MRRWVSFQLDELVIQQFDKLCSQRQISRSEYLRILVEHELVRTARQRVQTPPSDQSTIKPE